MTGRSALVTSDLGLTYTGQPEPLFSKVNLHLSRGWYGVTGPNGAGKSTLLSLFAGELEPTCGLVRAPPAILCGQDCAEPGPVVEEALHLWDNEAVRIRASLSLDDARVWDDWMTMSPGERRRWQIGAALMIQAPLLLLDEPTNHLDARSRAILLDALRRYRGIGVIVSHDRGFLDALTEHTIWVEDGSISLFTGSYSAARAAREARRAAYRQESDELAREGRVLARRYEAEQRSRARSEAQISPKHRMKSIRDTDARSMAAKARAINAERAYARRAAVSRGAIDRNRRARDEREIIVEDRTAFAVNYEPCRRATLLDLTARDLYRGGNSILSTPMLRLDRDAKVWITGENGAGKSTLLATLHTELALPEEKIVWLPQEMAQARLEQLLKDVREACRARDVAWLQVAHALGLDIEQLRRAEALSQGTARKLELARGLGAGVWCMMLDEPTNHLDVPSIEKLERALANFPGCVVLISHDQELARACCDRRWHVSDRAVTVMNDLGES